MLAKWTRDTLWRQGAVLPSDAVQALGLSPQDTPDTTCVVVISHDCDLSRDDFQLEPDVEVIIGCRIPKENGNYSWAKSPRTLHLEVIHGEVSVFVELVATAKCFIPKQKLAAFAPDRSYAFSGNSLSILRSWLAARYNRAAFPDSFVTRLSQPKVDKKLAKLIEPTGSLLSAVYFDVDGGKAIDRSDSSLYALKIVLAYPAGDEPEQTANRAEELATSIDALFSENYFDELAEKWNGIHLKACQAISEDDLTVSKVRELTQWRLEYMSFTNK